MELKNLIEKGESNTLEFKESFKYNIETNRKDKSLKNEVSKAVCGMLNEEGGVILIGVDDNKNIKGIKKDLALYGKENESSQLDKMLIDLNQHITDVIGIGSKQFIHINFMDIDGKKIIKIFVNSSPEPFYHSEKFYVRDGPRTIQLSGREMGEYISKRVKSSHIKSLKERLDGISSEFRNWVQDKLKKNLNLEINRNNQDGMLYDYIFGCIVPRSFHDDLIDFNSDLIKNYIDDYSIIKRSQTYKIPKIARQYEPNIGEDLLISHNGIVYFCINYYYINPEKPEFSLGILESRPYEKLEVKKHQEKYDAPFTTITWGKIESLLEVICFLFHPKCRISMVTTPTETFSLEIVVPNMIFNGKRRILSSSGLIPSYKMYLGDEKDISIREFFKYNEIPEFVKSLKKKISDYYQNPADKGYA